MDADDSNLIPTPTETSFIILGSQGESQRLSDTEQHAEILRSLPALQMPKKKDRNRSPRLLQQSEGSSSNTSTKAKARSADLVPDTASEEKQPENQQKTVSETELQDDDSVNITVTQSGSSSTKKTSGPSHGQDLLAADDCKNNQSGSGQDKEEQTSPTKQGNGSSNESSLSSRTKDTLGSYDQCELYKTQEEHIHGQRFSLFAPSQSEQDMFEDESDNDDEVRHVATPAQHIGSLQLSAEPMLVPESVDEAEYEIPPSPDIYDATHMIIPNSPTEGDSDGPETGDEEIADQTLCNLAAYNTMADKDDQVSRKACGVADDVQIGSNEESYHLQLSSSHTARETTEASHSQIEGSQEGKSLKSYQIRGQTMADEVIVIKSQTAEGETSDSQFFALRLSPSQGEVTQAYTALERKQSIPDTETVGRFLPREGTLLHPSSVVSPYTGQFTKGESQRQRSLVEEQIQTSQHKLNDNSSSVVQVAPLLTIGMIDTQSEQSPSQHRFHLEKPGAGDVGVETSEEYQKNVFQRARKCRKQPLIQDDSEDYVPNPRQEVVWEDTEQKLVSKELCTESQGESESNIHTSNDIREAMQLDTEPYDPNETFEPGTSSDQTKLREAVQCGGQMVSQPLITCTRQTVVAGLCPPLSVSVSVSRQGSSRVGEKQIPADISRHNERIDENALKESLSGKMGHSVQENPDAGKNVVQKIEDVSVPKPSVDVAGNTNHPMKLSLVEGQSPNIACTAERTTLLQTQRQESLGLASPNRLSTNKTITTTSSGLYNKNTNTSRRKISTGKGKLVYKGHRISRHENKMTSRSFELDTREHGYSEEQLHPSKRRKIDPYTFCGSESQTAPGREEIAQNPVHWTRRHSNPTSVTPERTPILSRKRRRLIHKKTGLLKSSSSGDSERSLIKPKGHVHFQADQTWHSDPSPWLAPGPSETARSPLPQYDQHFVTDSVVTPSAPTQPIIPSTLPQSALPSSLEKRSTLKQSTSLSLKGSQEEKFEKWTVVTKTVMQFTTVKVEEKVVHQGKILSEKVTSLVKEEPRAVKVTSQSECEFISPYPSPSRSVSTLTSGDLGDISSSSHGSQSRSISSDSSKASLLPSSLDRSNFGSQEQLESHHFVSPQAVVRTRTSVAQTQTPADSKEKEDQHVQPVTPSKIDTEAIIDNPHSDVEHSASGTPQEVSTINKTGSCNHTRTFSGEGSKASDSLFSPSEKSDSTVDKSCPSSNRKGEVTKPQLEPMTTSAAVGTSAVKAVAEMRSRKSESDEISPEIPYQDKVVSSPISDIESPTTASRTIKSSDQPGSNVFAKWKDGFFYPGKIVSTDRYNRYKVVFLDGDSQTVKSSNLLLVEQLPVGQSVLVKSREDHIYECGLIVQRSPSHYIVKKDDGNKGRYSLDAVILSEDHAKCLLMNEGDEARQICPVVGPPVLPTNLADISLDNLVEGKRRTCKSESHKADTESKVGGNESASKRGKKRKLGDIEPQATSTPTPKGKMEGATKDRGAPECSPLVTTGESPLTSRRQSPRKAKIGLFGDLKGPLPTKKTLYKGLVFMLTHVEKAIEQKEQEKKLLEDSSLEASTDSSTGEEEVQIPFDKDHLKEQIERGGGTVLEKFDPDLVCDSSHCYLLSSTYQRTIKYLQCLAAGVPCVSHLWIIDSCKQGLLLDYGHYILPAGISLEKKRIMECKAGTQPLLNMRVSVVSKNDKFAEEWMKILQLAKCVIIDKFPPQTRSDESSRPEVVITDSSISPAHIKRAQQLNIPLVSSQWVIQSLINGQQVKFDGHPQYSYNYSNV